MSSITYERSPRLRVSTSAAPKRQQGWLSAFYRRLIEARTRSAEAELRRHGLRLPDELEQAGWRINERSEDSLPFIR